MEVSGPGIGGLSWAEVQAILEGRALRVGLGCKGRGRNRANPDMVPMWGRSNSNRGLGSDSILYRTHGRTALGSDNGGGRRARVGTVSRGRRRLPHSKPEAVSSARLHHGWPGEEEEMERRGGGGFS